MDSEALISKGVTHVLNVAQQLPNYFEDKNLFVYCKIPLVDTEDTPLMANLPKALSFISHVERVEGRVFVHCIAGDIACKSMISYYFWQKLSRWLHFNSRMLHFAIVLKMSSFLCAGGTLCWWSLWIYTTCFRSVAFRHHLHYAFNGDAPHSADSRLQLREIFEVKKPGLTSTPLPPWSCVNPSYIMGILRWCNGVMAEVCDSHDALHADLS